MPKLHELLAVETSVTQAANKLFAETNMKFTKYNEFYNGHVRTLSRLKDSAEDRAIEAGQRREKGLPTTVVDTLDYVFPYVQKALDVKLTKHRTNQVAIADVELDGTIILANVPVDFLLDLEKLIPQWRSTFDAMPVIDPSRSWAVERKGVWKSEAPKTVQTEKILYPVELSPATDKHPAQVKEASKDIVVGTFSQTDISGAATSQQKSDLLDLCDRLLAAVKQARMRANSVDVKTGNAAAVIDLFRNVFN